MYDFIMDGIVRPNKNGTTRARNINRRRPHRKFVVEFGYMDGEARTVETRVNVL